MALLRFPNRSSVFFLLMSCALACGGDDDAVNMDPGADTGVEADSGANHGGHDAGGAEQGAGQDAGEKPPPPAPDAGRPEQDAGPNTVVDAGPPPPKCPEGEMPCDGKCVTLVEPTLEDIHARIIARTCAFSDSCHTGVTPKEKLDLTTLDSMLEFVGAPSQQVPSLSVIEPGAPDDSYLIHKLRGRDIADKSSTGAAATSMPPPPTRALCEEKIRVIEAWIRAGAKP